MLRNLPRTAAHATVHCAVGTVSLVTLCAAPAMAQCEDGVAGPPAICPGFAGFNCFTSNPFCDHCSSGCATISGLAGMLCAAVPTGGFLQCDPVYTLCSSFSTETIQACNVVCVCSIYDTYTAPCGGAFQSGCTLGAPCPVPAPPR